MYGIDPPSMVCGFLGVVIVQILLPSEKKSALGIAAFTFASVLFASLTAPLLTPVLLKVLKEYPTIQPEAARSVVAAVLGGFAQPALVFGKRLLNRRAAKILEGQKDA